MHTNCGKVSFLLIGHKDQLITVDITVYETRTNEGDELLELKLDEDDELLELKLDEDHELL